MNAQRIILLAALLGLPGINAPAADDNHGRSGRKYSHDGSHRVHDRVTYRQTRHHVRRGRHHRPRYHYKPRQYYRPHYGNNYAYGRGGYGSVGHGSGISVWVDGLGFTFYDYGY
jgi:hypothetical protein